MINENVVILGASDKEERYSFKANELLKKHNHTTFLVHPRITSINGEKVYKNISEIKDKIDTLTMYVRPELSSKVEDQILKLKPKRVIFNPGTENSDLEKKLHKSGISFEHACTLVLLNTDQY